MSNNFTSTVLWHDFFNLICLSIIGSLDAYYLRQSTNLSHIGTDLLGSDEISRSTYSIISNLFFSYLIIDIIWIILIPKCVLVKPYEVIIHHIATIALVLIPINAIQFQWHGALCISVELQTLVLTLKRRFKLDSLIYKLLNTFFYILWAIYRLILFPSLVIFFWFEYRRYSKIINSNVNIVFIASPLFLLLTLQGWVWTYKVLTKALNIEKNKSS